jgi:hypothetical protein
VIGKPRHIFHDAVTLFGHNWIKHRSPAAFVKSAYGEYPSGAGGEIYSVASTEEITTLMISPNGMQPDRTYSRCRMPQRALLPALRCQAVGALPKPSPRRLVAVSSPILSTVGPCFGQDCIDCLAVRRPKGESDRLLRGDIGREKERCTNRDISTWLQHPTSWASGRQTKPETKERSRARF